MGSECDPFIYICCFAKTFVPADAQAKCAAEICSRYVAVAAIEVRMRISMLKFSVSTTVRVTLREQRVMTGRLSCFCTLCLAP